MNTPEVFENAIRETIARYCADTIPSAWIRCSQRQGDLNNIEAKQMMPQCFISCHPKTWDNAGATWNLPFTIALLTLAEDDRDAAVRAGMFEAVEALFDKFFFAEDGEEVEFFSEVVKAERPGFVFGGFTPDSAGGATATNGFLEMDFGGTLHFSL